MAGSRIGSIGASLILSGLAHAFVLGNLDWAAGDTTTPSTRTLNLSLLVPPVEVHASTYVPPAQAGTGFAEAGARADPPGPARPAVARTPAPREPAPKAVPALAAPAPPVQPRPLPARSPVTAREDAAKLAGARTAPPAQLAPPPAEAVVVESPPAVALAVIESASVAMPTPAVARESSDSMLLQLLNRQIAAGRRYPRIARRQGREGTTRIAFQLHPNGAVGAIEVVTSSEFEPLDTAARLAVSSIAPFAAAADYLSAPQSFQVDVQFALR